MPDNDKLVMFDRKREILLPMAENIERASAAQLEELVAQLVERVETVDRRVSRVLWTPPARPFFADGEAMAEASLDGEGALLWRPQGDSNP